MNVSEIRELIDKLNYNTKLYDEGKPEISDQEWDDMYFKLVKLEQETKEYFEDSPTQRIDYQIVNKLKKVEHNHPMLSLDKTKDIKEIESFIGSKDYICMAKMDGLTCSLRYLNGKLVSAETRGNGIIGEDILHNALQIKNIPNKIDFKEELIVDGEIICTYKDFEYFKDLYKNPRNYASGSIRLLDSKECAMRRLTFVAWDCIKGMEDAPTLSNKLVRLNEILGFTIVPWYSRNISMKENIELVKKECKELNYPIDGLVFKFDNCNEYKAAGRTDHHFKGGMAYKFYDDEYETILRDVEWTMGRTGVLTPVAIFDSIDIDGTEVSRANLHNVSIMYETLHKMNVCGWNGQKIKVFKANQIIPQISWAEEDIDGLTKAYIDFPHICPICQGEVQIWGSSESSTQTLMCVNPNCEGKLVNKIEHFFGKKGLDAKGISKKTIEKLIDWGWVKSISDMFTLSDRKDSWASKVGFGDKSVSNILMSIQECANCNLESIISGAGIPLIGRTVARDITKRFNTYDSFREAIKGDFDFSKIGGYGYEMNKSLKTFNYDELDYIVDNYINFKEEENINYYQTIPGTTRLDGMQYCVTGKLKIWKNRDELTKFIESLGGKVTGSVTKNTNVLINNDINSTSAKNNKAKELGISILTEQMFADLVDYNKNF